jgi:hypothetical protein
MLIVSLIIVIVGLYILYKSREEEEDNLALKLIGYYILGIFYLNLNGLLIPLGFIISLFLKPTENRSTKRLAAIFGLIMMLLGFLFS